MTTTKLQPTDRSSSRETLLDALDDFSHAMLITSDLDGAPRARPMAIVEREAARLWFVTDRGSSKIDEIRDDAAVAVTMQSSSAFVSLTGTARIVDDRAKLEHVWTKALDPWFPDGAKDASACLIVLEPQHAELWKSGAKEGLAYLWEAAKAVAKDKRMEAPKRGHAELSAN